jgi:hypothetical protein
MSKTYTASSSIVFQLMDNADADLPAIFHTQQLSVTMSVGYRWHIVDKHQSYLKTTGKPEILFIRDAQGRPQSKDAPEYAELIEALVHRTETYISEAIPVYIHEPDQRACTATIKDEPSSRKANGDYSFQWMGAALV